MNKTRVTALALVVLLIAGLLLAVLGGERGAKEGAPILPGSIAAIGDSITRAVAADPSAPAGSPAFSWTTGDRAYSHRSRLNAAGASLGGEDVHNLAVPGARMEDAPAQARAAVDAGAQYITLLMGANDVCLGDLTSVTEFRGHFLATLNILLSRLPDAHVFVASIPDVDHLRTLFENDPRVTQLWDATGICPRILSSRATDAVRAEALERLRAFNQILGEGCGATTRCTFDDLATFEHRFERADVSPLDHFHPSARGQEVLAAITWGAGPWFDL